MLLPVRNNIDNISLVQILPNYEIAHNDKTHVIKHLIFSTFCVRNIHS